MMPLKMFKLSHFLEMWSIICVSHVEATPSGCITEHDKLNKQRHRNLEFEI